MNIFDKANSRSAILSALTGEGARIHLVGILGAGMSPIAEFLTARGITVTGTDSGGGGALDYLRAIGVRITTRHTADGLAGTDLVAYSLAVPQDSPELVYARGAGIPTVTRAELLGGIFSLFGTTVAVAGTHGKSTTTAMLDLILTRAGLMPTVISGATLTDGRALRLGGEGVLLAEACEYRNSFLNLAPTHALITNIELDHTDFFHSLDEVCDSFCAFAAGAERVYLNLRCPQSRRLLLNTNINAITFGTTDSDYALLHYELGRSGTDMLVRISGAVYPVHLSVIGMGNMLDALGAIAVSHSMGVPVSSILASLAAFSGIGRRMERVGTVDGRAIYYDYAHHPTEIENTVRTLTAIHSHLTVIFKPHTYSRTLSLMDDFAAALRPASRAVILDVYAAREPHVAGVSRELARRIGNNAVYSTDDDALMNAFDGFDGDSFGEAINRSDGAIVLMGAGCVDNILERIKALSDEGLD